MTVTAARAATADIVSEPTKAYHMVHAPMEA